MIESLKDKFSAVLFDFDGVLIDSMPHHVSAWQEILKGMGINIPDDRLRLAEGEKAKVTIRKLAAESNLSLDEQQLEDLVERKRQIYRKSAPKGLRPIASHVVKSFRNAGFLTAIVTGSARANLNHTLSEDELALFNVVISAENYQQGKPDPEPYLRAAELLKLNPEKCLVIENAPLGIRSAKAAGMTCIAIKTTLPESDLIGADLIINDLDAFIDSPLISTP